MELNFDDIKLRNSMAKDIVSGLCRGNIKWIMSIPARPGVDPDLIISEALRDSSSMIDYIEKLNNEIEILRRYGNKDCVAMADDVLANGE